MVKNRVFTDIFADQDDFIFMGNGDDVVTSTNGSDIIFTGQGDDNIVVSSRSEDVFVFGGKGDDMLMVLGDDLTKERHGDITVFTDDDGFRLIIKGVETIGTYDL